jgi:hypothetical protein
MANWTKGSVRLYMCLIKCHAMETYGEEEVWFKAFLMSALLGGESSGSRHGGFVLCGNSF